MNMRDILIVAVIALVSACAPLTAKAPLFPPQQTSPSPLPEGVWVQLSETCHPETASAAALPADCTRSEVLRLPNGAWRFELYPQNDADAQRTGADAGPLQ
jgi:hypothetical protein